MKEKENILDILKKVPEAIEKEDVAFLKNLSNRTIHTATIYQDPDNIAVAVIVYALGKIIERKKYALHKEWPSFFSEIKRSIAGAAKSLEEDNIFEVRENLKKTRVAIEKLTGNLKKYIEEVFRKASINKASRIYEHGISMEITASLLGITIFELAEYAGQTGISDVDLSITKPAAERIKFAIKLFEK